MDVEAGMLLLATPELLDPNFADTVVLMLDVNDEGALGVVINRPSVVLVSEVLDSWTQCVAEPEVLFRGGPVGPEGAIAVGLLREECAVPPGFREVVGQMGIVDLDTPDGLIDDALVGMRIFAGYAGWGREQLEREIEEGSWYVVAGHADDVLREDTTHLWRDVMRRQPGQLAWHMNRPIDPELN